MAANNPNPSEIKISIIPPGKEPQKANVLAEGRGNFEEMVKEDTYIIYVFSYRSKNCL